MSVPNRGVNFGHSSKLIYDSASYNDFLQESVSPMAYRLNPNQIDNCNRCLNVFIPPGSQGFGNSLLVNSSPAPAQDLADLESILTNRNVLASKTKASGVNDIDVTKFQLQHARICNDSLSPLSSLLSDPVQNYRGMSINRFYDLDRPVQNVIYFDQAINSSLEAKDNFQVQFRAPIAYDRTLPVSVPGRNISCSYPSYTTCSK